MKPRQAYGEPLFTFGDHRAPQWAAVAFGLALLAAAILTGLAFAFAGKPLTTVQDFLVVGAFVGMLALGGGVSSTIGVRDLPTDPEWHVSSTHVFRTRGSRVVKAYALRDLPRPKVEPHDAYGWTVGVWIHFGRQVLVAPTEDVAQAVVEAWQGANAR